MKIDEATTGHYLNLKNKTSEVSYEKIIGD